MNEERANISESEMRELICLINNLYGYDFSNYAADSFKRRIYRILILHHLTYSKLVNKITTDAQFFNTFIEEITVQVTEIFRDPPFYNFLRKEIIPHLHSFPIIRIWHAGCATGEEVYSMAMLLKEAGLLEKTLIYATDISQNALQIAKEGKYNKEMMSIFTNNYIESGGQLACSDFCATYNNQIVFNEELKKRIIFSYHNLVTDQSFNEFNLILCRNVMIYFNKTLQNTVLKLFTKSLIPFGYLALGSKESIDFSCSEKYYETISKTQKVYRKKGNI